MIFTETALPGAFTVDPDPIEDERGWFARTWCASEFRDHGLNPDLSQCSVSFNRCAGTIRGMHWQESPHQEAKLIRCTAGAIRDVIVDLRPDSALRYHWTAVDLTAQNRRMLYVPEGFAHGFETLQPESEVMYMISSPYVPESARGFRWDDPAVGISWLTANPILSERDRGFLSLADTMVAAA
jgi:dTDP-4-dehydrorhamnose 3,5-epimerase